MSTPASTAAPTAESASDLLQLVSFVIEGEEFGIDILKVQEIIRPVPITRVPNAPAFVEGVINLRGRIVPVIDARRRFGLPAREMDEDSRIVVIELSGRTVGFIMDAVREVIRVERGVIEPPPELAIGIDADYLSGVAKLDDRLLILLDVERVLADDERDALADAVPPGDGSPEMP
jgi:purine-binding chemotaxis protein CheW